MENIKFIKKDVLPVARRILKFLSLTKESGELNGSNGFRGEKNLQR